MACVVDTDLHDKLWGKKTQHLASSTNPTEIWGAICQCLCKLTGSNGFVFFYFYGQIVRVNACHSRVSWKFDHTSKGHLYISKGSLRQFKGSLKHQKGHLNIKRVTSYIEGDACQLRVDLVLKIGPVSFWWNSVSCRLRTQSCKNMFKYVRLI